MLAKLFFASSSPQLKNKIFVSGGQCNIHFCYFPLTYCSFILTISYYRQASFKTCHTNYSFIYNLSFVRWCFILIKMLFHPYISVMWIRILIRIRIRRFLRPRIRIRDPHILRIRIPDPECFLSDFYKNEYTRRNLILGSELHPPSFPFPLTQSTAQNEAVCL